MERNSVFLKACRREPVSHTPVWLMRQAGRYMKEYRELREKTPFLEICKNKSLAAEITVMAQEKIKADAAIIFSDILVILEPMGLGLDYIKGDGPSVKRLESAADVEKLPEIDPKGSLSFVMEAIREARQSLKAHVPLIGFAGAPFTIASYMIEGGPSRDFERTKAWMRGETASWKALMAKLTRATIKYLSAQIEAGVQAVQLFDSWVGCLRPEEYRTFVLPYSQHVILGLKGKAPVIHFGTGTENFLELMSQAGGEVIGVDHGVKLGEAWQRIGFDKGIQGNLNPKTLLGSLEGIRAEARRVLKEADGRPGHIFNLGHGVLPETPVENVIALVDIVHEMSQQ
ncbi:MAG: uroporphyrinogen decarboxylase [Candidatus Omnitrophota bacterium]